MERISEKEYNFVENIAAYHAGDVLKKSNKNPIHNVFDYTINIEELNFNEQSIELYKKLISLKLHEFDLKFQKLDYKLVIKGIKKYRDQFLSNEIIHNMKLSELENYRKNILGSFEIEKN